MFNSGWDFHFTLHYELFSSLYFNVLTSDTDVKPTLDCKGHKI